MTLDLIKSVALLLALSMLHGLNVRMLRDNEMAQKVFSGCLFGGICIIGMMMPIEVIPGVIFDARSVVLSIAGAFGGPIVGVISAALAGGYRMWIGGGGAPVGVAVVLTSSSLGLAYWYARQCGWLKVGVLELFGLGLLVHLVEVLLFTQLPVQVVDTVMSHVAVPLVLSFTPATVLLGVILKDVEERLKTEWLLRKSEERLSHHIENTPLGAIAWDEDFYCTEWNKAAEQIFGYTSEEAIGRHGSELVVPAQSRDQVSEVYQALLSQNGGTRNTNENQTKSGRTITCDWYNTPILDAQGQAIGVTSLVQDITERKQAEAHLVQVSKLASLGEMATGIAHELSQPLNIIRMSADTVIFKMDKGDVPAEFMQTQMNRISKQVVRAATIIDHLRVFGREASENMEPISLNDVVSNAVGFVREQMRLNDIHLETALPDTCRPVLGHIIQMEQVVINLLSNARDAILENRGDGANDTQAGTISVRLIDDPESAELFLIVQDNGGGIPEDVLPNIFDPFFTTKEIGKGTGVGLSISYGIVSEMGGIIRADNVEGGARFITMLPTLDGQET